MAQGLLTLDLKGFSEVMANLEKMDKAMKQEVSGQLERGAQIFVRNAKRDAPVEHGRLRNSIDYFPHDRSLSYNVSCSVDYAPYVEFGTIKYVFYGEYWLDDETVAYAGKFKGRGVRKNGGIYPRPFFYKQEGVVKQNIEQGIEALLKDLKL